MLKFTKASLALIVGLAAILPGQAALAQAQHSAYSLGVSSAQSDTASPDPAATDSSSPDPASSDSTTSDPASTDVATPVAVDDNAPTLYDSKTVSNPNATSDSSAPAGWAVAVGAVLIGVATIYLYRRIKSQQK